MTPLLRKSMTTTVHWLQRFNRENLIGDHHSVISPTGVVVIVVSATGTFQAALETLFKENEPNIYSSMFS